MAQHILHSFVKDGSRTRPMTITPTTAILLRYCGGLPNGWAVRMPEAVTIMYRCADILAQVSNWPFARAR